MQHTRFVAVGDSLTQGRGDLHPDGSIRGFADLLAGALHEQDGAVVYANLARPSVRAREVLRDQVPLAVAAAPDVVSVVAGVNDVIAVRLDTAGVGAALDAVLGTLRAGLPEARIVTATLPDLGGVNVVARAWRGRILSVNAAIRCAAATHDVEVVDLERTCRLGLQELALDRVHPSPEGHLRIAQAFGEALGVTVPQPSFMASRPRQESLRRLWRTAAVAPRFLARRLAREALITAQPPKRGELSPL